MAFLLFNFHTFDCNGSIATPSGPSSLVCATYDTEYVFEGSYDLKLAIATEMLETVDWNEETQAKARQYLYNLLMQDTVLANSNSAFLDFIAEYEEWLQSVYEVSNDLRNIEQYDSLFTALIIESDSLIRYYSDSLTVIFNEGREEELSQTVEDFYYQINFLEQTRSNLISQRQAFVEGELGEIVHDYVVSPELPAVNTQYVDAIYSDYLESGENDDVIYNEYSNLLGVASQCPAAGGQAVHRARAMLALINDSLEYDDLNACLQVGIYKETASEEIDIEFDFNLIPNPATTEVFVEFITKQKGNCNLKIYNALGSSLSQFELDCEISQHIINLNAFVSGVYMIEIKFRNYKQIKKLVIIK
jgi:hypothetical protein